MSSSVLSLLWAMLAVASADVPALQGASTSTITIGNETEAGSSNTYVLAMQKCKGSSTWTNHGLWPEWGQDCGGDAFDVSQISSIKSSMEKYWLSCPEYSDSNEEFWSHEWSKHGTCTTMSQLDYFTEGLSLRSKYQGGCTSSDGSSCEFDCSASFTCTHK
mmetsp:Transcript_22976/g.53217  ORF Transcript_22976/g.53217 Transcript_22976/m.53217 type:complete len:161 (-) Transcript_22976:93-575(-)|eukprot:CAMPEP_0182559688 /NCGR_PEP_ID=MMETSP1324-20130603/2714_1 /TAXON_ID=236786 /ORGANISM="Florenciella sp., Strain RCC1587" /LENGTH=160 /DNA_ID=CAMNT_0024771971 /DNA_START=126 /DNA_END=608 /DNA_ORIENTATION=-